MTEAADNGAVAVQPPRLLDDGDLVVLAYCFPPISVGPSFILDRLLSQFDLADTVVGAGRSRPGRACGGAPARRPALVAGGRRHRARWRQARPPPPARGRERPRRPRRRARGRPNAARRANAGAARRVPEAALPARGRA